MSSYTGKRRAETSSSKKAVASPCTSKMRPATSPPTTSPVTPSRVTFARGQMTVTATAETRSPSVATSSIVVWHFFVHRPTGIKIKLIKFLACSNNVIKPIAINASIKLITIATKNTIPDQFM